MTPWLKRIEHLDEQLTHRVVLPEGTSVMHSIARLISQSADSWYWLGGLLVAWVLSSPPWKERAFLAAYTIGVLALVVIAIKKLIRRQRPPGEWGQVYRLLDPHSFPSGHAARAMSLAILALFFGLTPLSILLFIWTGLVSWSRIALRLHFAVDIFGGWLLGMVLTIALILTFPGVITIYSVIFP